MRKLATAAAIAATCASVPALAATGPNAPYRYYGNISATGAQGCSAISGNFPTSIGYEYASGGNNLLPIVVVLNIQIENPAAGVGPQNLQLSLNPTTNTTVSGGTSVVQDPLLFGASTALNGITGTYTGTVNVSNFNAYLQVENVVVTSQFSAPTGPSSSTTETCVLTLNGLFYFSP